MRSRVASLLRRLAQRIDPAPTPQSTFPAFPVTINVSSLAIDPAKIGREISREIDQYARRTGRGLL